MSGGGRPPVYHDARLLHADIGVWDSSPCSRGATSPGSQHEDRRFGEVRAWWRRRRACYGGGRSRAIFEEPVCNACCTSYGLANLGLFCDHLLSEHTPFTVTVLHPLELDHPRFFHSLRSLQPPFRLDALATRCHVLHLRSRFPTSARKTRSSKLYVRTTGEKDCAEYPQHTSRTERVGVARVLWSRRTLMLTRR
jgi:hypothetical protein